PAFIEDVLQLNSGFIHDKIKRLIVHNLLSFRILRSVSGSSPLSGGTTGCGVDDDFKLKPLLFRFSTSIQKSSSCPFRIPTIRKSTFPDPFTTKDVGVLSSIVTSPRFGKTA